MRLSLIGNLSKERREVGNEQRFLGPTKVILVYEEEKSS